MKFLHLHSGKISAYQTGSALYIAIRNESQITDVQVKDQGFSTCEKLKR